MRASAWTSARVDHGVGDPHHPVADRGPQNGQTDPIPKVRKRPKVNQLHNGLVEFHPALPLFILARTLIAPLFLDQP